MLWYSLEAPHRGASNGYPQHSFFGEIRKIICEYPFLTGVLVYPIEKMQYDANLIKIQENIAATYVIPSHLNY